MPRARPWASSPGPAASSSSSGLRASPRRRRISERAASSARTVRAADTPQQAERVAKLIVVAGRELFGYLQVDLQGVQVDR
eukprot:11289326-Alexandrium_andersonii.AAC.1